jgi:hypothetical protein
MKFGVRVRFFVEKGGGRFIDKELDDRETSSITGATYVRYPRFFDIFGVDEDEDDVDRDDDDDELEKRADRAASTCSSRRTRSHTAAPHFIIYFARITVRHC